MAQRNETGATTVISDCRKSYQKVTRSRYVRTDVTHSLVFYDLWEDLEASCSLKQMHK